MPIIGVAVAVPEPWGRELQEYRASVGDAHASMIPTHITLVPPLEVEHDLAVIEAHLAQVASSAESFCIHLRGTGTFRPVSPVVFVSLVEGISQSEQLAASVRSGPLTTELDYPYHPHVTVAHHLDDAALDRAFEELADFECVFEAGEFHLYVHDEHVGWQPTRGFDLVPRPDLEE